MKIIVFIIRTNLVTNSLLSLFWSFIETKNKSRIFSKYVGSPATSFSSFLVF